MRLTNGVSIGALSKGTGVNIETIRFYERIGVMPAPERSPGKHTSIPCARIGWLSATPA